MKLKTTIAALIVSAIALPVLAQMAPATPNVDQRIANQEKRIDQGVKSGALNARETERVERREDKIRADETAAKADGKVTKQERKHLQHELNNQSRAIHREKHDRQHEGKHGKGKHQRN